MFKTTHAFSSFSVNDIEKAKEFYGQTLGLDVTTGEMGILTLKIPDGFIDVVNREIQDRERRWSVVVFWIDDDLAAAGDLERQDAHFARRWYSYYSRPAGNQIPAAWS